MPTTLPRVTPPGPALPSSVRPSSVRPSSVQPGAALVRAARPGARAAPPITRDGARRDAARELSRHMYQAERPGPVHRAEAWLADRLHGLSDGLVGHLPGRGVGALGLVALAVVAVAGVRIWLGPARRTARRAELAADGAHAGPATAADLRAAADAYAARGAWAEAVRARLRAAVRCLEERGMAEPRPGRTLGELETVVGAAVPGAAAAFAGAARAFGEIWYGGARADAEAYRAAVAADTAITRATVARAAAVTAGATGATGNAGATGIGREPAGR